MRSLRRRPWLETTSPMWAPEVRYLNGLYYMYYVGIDPKDYITGQTCGAEPAIGLATSPNPNGPWTDLGHPVVYPRSNGGTCNFFWTYDPAITQDDSGQLYIYFGSYYGGIFVRRLSADGTTSDPASEVQVAIANRYEGAFIQRHGGFYYLFVSATDCCRGPLSGYSVFAGRSANPLGPFVDQQGIALTETRVGGTPVISMNGNRWMGPGHNAVAADAAGQDWFYYHAIDSNDPYLSDPNPNNINKRHFMMDRLDWINGWPTVRGDYWASDGPQPAPIVDPGITPSPTPAPRPMDIPDTILAGPSDEFNGALEPQWTWVRPPPTGTVSLTEHPGFFRFRTQDADLYEDNNSASVLTEPAPAGDFLVEAKFEFNLPPNGCCFNYRQAGLLLYQDDDQYVKLAHVSIWETRQTEWAKEVAPPAPARPRRYGNTVIAVPGAPGVLTTTTWLRIVKRTDSGTQLYTGYTSFDGLNWVRGATWTHNLSNLKIALVSMGGTDFTADFDYVHVYTLAPALTTTPTQTATSPPTVTATRTATAIVPTITLTVLPPTATRTQTTVPSTTATATTQATATRTATAQLTPTLTTTTTRTPTVTITRTTTRTATVTATVAPCLGLNFARTDYVTGGEPFAAAAGDFNSDGYADLIIANKVLLNLGNGTFGAATSFGANITPRSIAVQDFNRDGVLDLALVNDSSNTVLVLFGTGTGTFNPPTTYTGYIFPTAITAGDFNGDGDPDLAVADGALDTVSILLNVGNGTFVAVGSNPIGTGPVAVVASDLNNDSHLDLAVANNSSGDVSVLFGSGSGTFSTATQYSAGGTPTSLVSADFNSDGHPDLALANTSNSTLAVLLNIGNGTFPAPVAYPDMSSPASVAAADFTGDGRIDLVTANTSSNGVALFVGVGNGTFGAATLYATDSSPGAVVAADFNGDNRPDLATANIDPGTTSVLLAGCALTPTSTATGTTTQTATATSVPPSATRTATIAPSSTVTIVPSITSTAVPSETPCTIQFSDVQDQTAYYYQGVYYLACHGVVSGYSDGTYKPFNNTTRAQMAKIVVLAFNLPLVGPPLNPTFADVDSSSVFYQLIETAAARGIISGYTCGGINPQTGAAEPCTSGNRPYFRPSNFVTRGQLAKIVVLGAGFPLINPPTPTFTDVPRSDVFYQSIETAVCHGIISGYSDNTFRPNNFAFRGQIAKIVYLAVTNPQGTCPAGTPTR